MLRAATINGVQYVYDANGNVIKLAGLMPNALKPISRVGTYKLFGSAANGDAKTAAGIGNSQANVYSIKFEVEADFDAVQLVWENHVTSGPLRGVKAVVCSTDTAATDTQAHMFWPVSGASTNNAIRNATDLFGWNTFTFGGAATGIVPPGQVTPVMTPGKLESDWMNCQSLVRNDGGTLPLVMFRTYYSPTVDTINQSYYSQANAVGMRAKDAISNRRIIQLGIAANDGVGTLGTTLSLSWTIPTVYLRIRHRTGVITVVGVGDSITQGTTNSYDTTSNWLMRACNSLSTPALPIIPMNEGANGMTTAIFQRNCGTLTPINATPYSIPAAAISSGYAYVNTSQRPQSVFLTGATTSGGVTINGSTSMNTAAFGNGNYTLQSSDTLVWTYGGGTGAMQVVQSPVPSLAIAKPDIAVYSPFSPNDNSSFTARDAADMLARMENFLDFCTQYQIFPIIWTGVPDNAWSATYDNARKAFNTIIRAMTRVPVMDFAAAVGDGATPERWIPAYNAWHGWQNVTLNFVAIASTTTGLTGGTTYSASITIDGTATTYSNTGDNIANYGALITDLNAQLNAGMGTSGLAYASLNGGSIQITSMTSGVSSTLTTASASQNTSTGLFATATQAYLAGTPVHIIGTPPTGFSNSTTYYVIATGLTTTACELSATLGGGAIVPSVSSACTLAILSSVAIATSGTYLFPALTGYNAVQTAIAGLADGVHPNDTVTANVLAPMLKNVLASLIS